MNMPLQDLLLQRLRHLTIVFFLRTSANQASSFALGLASVILIFLIFVSFNTIYVVITWDVLISLSVSFNGPFEIVDREGELEAADVVEDDGGALLAIDQLDGALKVFQCFGL